jgi:hypothetical protein
MSFYSKLREAEQVKEKQEKENPRFLPGYIAQVQRDAFAQYESNPVLAAALRGEKTVEQSLEDIAKYNRNLRRFLPRPVNKKHNKKVHDVQEIVDNNIGELTALSVFAPDNLFTQSAFTGVLMYCGYELVGLPLAHSLVAYAGCVPFMLFTSLMFRRPVNEETFEQARYIDRKIQEFYNRLQKAPEIWEGKNE